VIDVHGITDDQVAELEGHIGPDGVITLTTALAFGSSRPPLSGVRAQEVAIDYEEVGHYRLTSSDS